MAAEGSTAPVYTPLAGLYRPGVPVASSADAHTDTPPLENTLAVPMPPENTFWGMPLAKTFCGEFMLFLGHTIYCPRMIDARLGRAPRAHPAVMQFYQLPIPNPADWAWKVLMRKPCGLCVSLPSDATRTVFVMETWVITEGHGFVCYSSRTVAEGAAPTELLKLPEWRDCEFVAARVTPVVPTQVCSLGVGERIIASNMFVHDVAPLQRTDGRAILPGGVFSVTGLPQPVTLRIEGDTQSLSRAPCHGKWGRDRRVGTDWHDPLFRIRDDTVAGFLQRWEVGVIHAQDFRAWVRPLLPSISKLEFSEHGGDTATTSNVDAYRVVNEAGPTNHVFIELQQ